MEQHSKALFKLPRAELVKILKVHGIIGHSKLKKREIVQEMLRLCETPEGGALSRSIKKYTMKAHEAGITSRAQALKGGALQDEFQNSEITKYTPREAKEYLTKEFLPPTHSETGQETILDVKPTDRAVLANYMELPYITRDSKGNFLSMNKLYIHNDYVDRLEKALSTRPSIVQSDPDNIPEFVSGIDLYFEYQKLWVPPVKPPFPNKIILIGETHTIYSFPETQLSGGRHVPFMSWINGLKQRHNIVAFGENVKRLKQGVNGYIVTDQRTDYWGEDIITKLYDENSFQVVDKLLRAKLSAKNPKLQSEPHHIFYPEVIKYTEANLFDQINEFFDYEQIRGTFVSQNLVENDIKIKINAYIKNVIDFLSPKINNSLITFKATKERLEALRDLFMLFCDVLSLLFMYKYMYSATSPINIIIMNGQRHTDFLFKYLFNIYYTKQFVGKGGQIAGRISAVDVSQIQWI